MAEALSAGAEAVAGTQSVVRTSVANATIGATGSAVDSMAHGETPDAVNMALAGSMTLGMSAAAGRAANSQAIRSEVMAGPSPTTPAGIGQHVASTTQSAGSAAATQSLAGTTAQVGSDLAASASQKQFEKER